MIIKHRNTRFGWSLFIVMLACLACNNACAQNSNKTQNATEQTTEEAANETAVRTGTGKQEDIGRFMGTDPVLERYISLPYDTLMNVNMKSSVLCLSVLLALFLPLILLFGRNTGNGLRILFMVLLAVALLFSVSSAYLERYGLDQSAAIHGLEDVIKSGKDLGPLQKLDASIRLPMLRLTGPLLSWIKTHSDGQDGFTYPLLFGGFICLLLLGMYRFRELDIMSLSVLLLLSYYGFLWLILSGGIAWYGILMFPLGLLLVVFAMVKDQPKDDQRPRLRTSLLLGGTVVWLILFMPLRFSGFYPKPDFRGKLPHYPEIINYQAGVFSASEAIDKLYPQAQKAGDILNADENSLIYGIGSFIPFFVKKSDQRIFQDPYLDFFMKLIDTYPDREQLAKALYANGIRYILLDVRIPKMDQTANQSLKKKFERFLVDFIYKNNHVEVVATDQRIKLNRDGSEIFGIGLYEPNTVVRPGRFVVYRLF